MNRGATLFELLTVLLILGMGGSLFLGQARSVADALAVRTAREEVVSLFHRARMEARVHGEARVLVREDGGVLLRAPDGRIVAHSDPSGRGVELRIRGERAEVEIRFGPLGLAGFASATLEFRKGGREAELVVSGYGRVRR
jgi:Tfp pilus assembly protein FimT